MLKVSKLVPRSVLRATLSTARMFLCDPFVRRLERASHDQQEWLLRRIRACQKTTFGQDHHFQTIRTLSDFRKQVPVSEYARLAPYINSVAAGQTQALIPDQDQLIQFTITTGSTGVPKLNPVTRSWLREYRAGWEIWGTRLFTDHPGKIGSRVLQMSGTWDMGKTVGGHQISMVSALLTRTQSPLVKPFYAIPDVVNDIRDPVVRHYVALRLTILDDIGWIMLMNPGTLIRLAEIGDQNKGVLIRDVCEGTISRQFDVPEPIRNALKRYVPPADSRGARRLEEIANRTGRLMPDEYWKQPVITCWLGGTAGFPSRYLHESFGSSPLRDMGLVSSEGRHTIPLQDTAPYGVPSIGAGFYEFIPVDELESTAPTVLEGHELKVDCDYRLVITNSAGYYRFDIGDIVRCRGFIGQAPQLEFIQKHARVGDLEGEKLTEHQLIEGAHKAAATVGVKLGLLTGVPRRIPDRKPYYDFLVTISEFQNSELAKAFLTELDLQLASLNFLWRARRKEGVLAAPRLLRLPPQGWENYIQAELRRKGTGDYQYKHPGLVQHQDWLSNFSPVDTIVMD